MLKLLLINPPQTIFSGSIGRSIYFPIGLMYLGAVARELSNVEIFDSLTSNTEIKDGNAITYGSSDEEIRRIIAEKYRWHFSAIYCSV